MVRSIWGPLTRAWRFHLLALGALLALTSFLVSVSLGVGAVGAAGAIRDALAAIEGGPAYVISTRLASDPDSQDRLVRAALEEELPVPFTVDRAEVDSPGDTPFAQWEVRIPAVSSQDVAGLIDAGDRIRLALRDTSAVVRGIQVEDALTPQLAPIAETIPNLHHLTLVPALLLLTLAVVVIVQASSALPRSREQALRILDARGLSRLGIAAHAACEALVIGVIGAAVGVALARVALQPWGGGPLELQLAAGAVLMLGLIAASARSAVAASHRAGRAARVTPAALLLIVAVLTGVTMWRLLRTGLDTISAPAVGLAALAGCMLALVIVVPTGVGLAGASSRARGLVVPLSFRCASRRHAASAPAALLVALAVGSVSLAAVFDGTEQASRARDATLDSGSDLRIVLPTQVASRPGTPTAPFAEIDGVAGVIGARVAAGSIAQEPAVIVALPTERAAGVAAGEIPAELESEPAGLAVQAGTHTVDVEVAMVEIEGRAPAVDVPVNATAEVWTIDADGNVVATQSDPHPMDLTASAQRASIPIHPPEGAERLLGVGVRWALQDVAFLREAPAMGDDDFFRLSAEEFQQKLAELDNDGYPGPNSWFRMEIASMGWGGESLDWKGAAGGTSSQGDGHDGGAPFEVMSMFPQEWTNDDFLGAIKVGADIDSAAVAAIANPEVVELLALEIGDTFGVTLDGPTWNFTLVGISSDIPASGGARAVMVDQNRLSEFLFANGREPYGASEAWLALDGTRDADAVAEDALAIEPNATRVEAQLDPTLAAGTTRWAFWGVAGAALGLTFVGLMALRLSESGVMAEEARILGALGAAPRTVRAAHRGELYARAIPSAIGGALVGAALGYYVIPGLVSLASGSLREPVIGVAWAPLGIGLALLACVLVAAARVRRRP